MRLFVDANVFLYASDGTEPRKQERAVAWLGELWKEESGRTSMQVLSEYYVNLKKMAEPCLPEDDAWARVARYLSWRPQVIDESLIRVAREVERRWRISWWDAMVVAAAQLQHCALLLTEDLQDGMVFGSVTVRSPFTLEIGEPPAAYAPQPALASLHRPRGRPRRTALA